MIRNVMVLAIACLMLGWTKELARTAGSALTPGRSEDAAGRRLAGLRGGCRRRRSPGRYPERYLGASTAAPPISRPGINAASIKATPAVITPTVAAVVTKACVSPDLPRPGDDAGRAGPDLSIV